MEENTVEAAGVALTILGPWAHWYNGPLPFMKIYITERRYLQKTVKEDVINELCHLGANQSTVILAEDFMVFSLLYHTFLCYRGLYFAMPNNGFKTIYQKIWGPSKLLGLQARARFALWLLRPWKLQIDTALTFDQYIQISELAT